MATSLPNYHQPETHSEDWQDAKATISTPINKWLTWREGYYIHTYQQVIDMAESYYIHTHQQVINMARRLLYPHQQVIDMAWRLLYPHPHPSTSDWHGTKATISTPINKWLIWLKIKSFVSRHLWQCLSLYVKVHSNLFYIGKRILKKKKVVWHHVTWVQN